MLRRIFLVSCVAAALLALWGCRPGEDERAAAPGPQQPVQGVVKLSPDAQQRAGLVTAKLARRPVQESLTLVGWLATMPGREVVVRSPESFCPAPPNTTPSRG